MAFVCVGWFVGATMMGAVGSAVGFGVGDFFVVGCLVGYFVVGRAVGCVVVGLAVG